MKKLKLKNNETIITVICITSNGVEWKIIKQDGNTYQEIDKGTSEIKNLDLSNGIIPINNIPNELLKKISGKTYLSIPSKIILTKIDTLPSNDLNEINKMAKIQIDKISPFSSEKILYGNEILELNDNSSNVIMMSTQKKYVDEITRYVEKNIFIKGIDARIMGWLELINQNNKQPPKDEIILLYDKIDLVLIFKKNFTIELIRPLYINLNSNSAANELLYELSYTLQNKEIIYKTMSVWAYNKLSNLEFKRIEQRLNIKIDYNDLNLVGMLSDGILKRIINKKNHINFLPENIKEKQKQKFIKRKLKKTILRILLGIIIVLTTLEIIFNLRLNNLKKSQSQLNKIEISANTAIENYNKLKALKSYNDRSYSSLECLREITNLLPAGDIEFSSFNYNKFKGVTITGSSINDDIVLEYFKKLGNSSLFNNLKNQSIRTSSRTSNGIKRIIFSVSLELSNKGKNED